MRKTLHQLTLIGAAMGALFAATSAQAYQPTNEAETLLVSWLEEGGCALPQKDFMNRALSAEGIAPSELMAARRAMTKANALVRKDGGIVLTTGATCGNDAVKAVNAVPANEAGGDDDRSRIMAMFETNGCTLTDDQLPDVAAQFQITRKQFRSVARAMEDAGELVEEDDRITLTVGGVCGGEKTAQSNAVADTPEMASLAMIAAMEAGGCTIDEAGAVAIGKDNGFSASSIDDAFDLLEDRGSIVISDDRDSARLIVGEVCNQANEERLAGYEPKTDDERTVLTLFEENGCSLTENQLPALGGQYGLDKDAFRTAGRALKEAGLFAEEGDTITLLGGKCAEGATETSASVDKRALVMQVFEKNGCTLSREEARTLLPAAGLTLDEDRALVRDMIAAGDVSLNRLTREATLVTGAVCGEAPDKRSIIISVFEANNCRMNEDQAMSQFPAAGLDLERDEDVIVAMFDAGELIEGEDDTARLVIGDKCLAESNVVRDAVIAAFSSNNCVLTEETFEAAISGGSVDVDEAGELVEAMMESGEVVYDKTTQQARLTVGPACAQ